MSAVSLYNSSRSEKTFAVAIGLLGAIAAAQILAALYLSARQPREAQLIAPQTHPTRPSPRNPVAAAPVTVPAIAGAPQTTLRQALPPPVSVAETLLGVAKGLRERGDTTNAIAKMQQATALDPGNAEILAELALTYESMQLFDRSNEVWRRLQSLGSVVGPLYELADVKLRVGVPARANPVGTAAEPNDAAGIPDGSTFGISEVALRPEADPEAKTKLLLRVGVKARPDTSIDHTKVKIQVFFYDMVNNDQVALTDAEVSYEWVTPGHNWADTGTEVLDVTYLRPKRNDPVPGTAIANEPVDVPDSVEKARRAKGKAPTGAEILPTSESGARDYLGYIVRVYYKEQLQAVRADPTRLLNLFPPPFTAPPQ